MKDFTHINKSGNPHIVDIGKKKETLRVAIAKGTVKMNPETLEQIKLKTFKKGDVLSVAQLSGIMATKLTSQIIPLCHPISIEHVDVNIEVNDKENSLEITSECKVSGKTGVEMEALTSVTTTALTIYDMCKSIDKTIYINNIHLHYKSGGKSGIYNAKK